MPALIGVTRSLRLLGLSHSIGAKPTGPRNLAGARRGSAERPKVRISQSISRVLDGMRKPIRIRDGHSSWTPVARRLQQPTRDGGSRHRPEVLTLARQTSCRPYSVLLPVGFALPPALPPARCALTAPFHPCRGLRNAPRRFVLCGTFPRLAPAGRYPAPLVHGARTFLPGNLSVLPERPSDRLTPTGMGRMHAAVKRRVVRRNSWLKRQPLRGQAGACGDRPDPAALRG